MQKECWYKNVCSQECSDSCIRYLEMLNLLEMSGLPENKWYPSQLYPEDSDYSAFKKLARIKHEIVDFVSNGENLYLYSEKTGNGKTTWAIKIMLRYFHEIWAGNGFRCRGLFIHVPTFLTKLKNFNSKDLKFEQTKELLFDVDLVIWDDIASTDLSSYDNSQLLTYVDTRILGAKSNIFTGNVGERGITKMLGTRLASRVWNNSELIEFNGGDKR